MLLIPLRILLIPRLPFTDEELAILDGPTASPFVSRFPRKASEFGGCWLLSWLTLTYLPFISNCLMLSTSTRIALAASCLQGPWTREISGFWLRPVHVLSPFGPVDRWYLCQLLLLSLAAYWDAQDCAR